MLAQLSGFDILMPSSFARARTRSSLSLSTRKQRFAELTVHRDDYGFRISLLLHLPLFLLNLGYCFTSFLCKKVRQERNESYPGTNCILVGGDAGDAYYCSSGW